ncbi:MAG: cyclase family protein [Actinomycetota bacterium]
MASHAPGTDPELPDYDELPLRGGRRASWDVWPEPDGRFFGNLNLLTPERIVAAAGLIREGRVFPMNWSMGLPDPPLFGRQPFAHEVTGGGTSTSHDDVLHGWNTQSSSQWDGFRHIRNHAALQNEDGSGHFGGVDDEEHGIDHWARRGIAGRAVLADLGRWRESIGRPIRCDDADAIEPAEIDECLRAQGTRRQPGDVLLLRFGWIAWYEKQSRAVRERIAGVDSLRTPGLRSGEELARVLWNLRVAAVGCDNPAVEVWPPGAATTPEHEAEVRGDRTRLHEIFTHTLLLPMLGIPLGEMWYLDALAEHCAAVGRYECFFVSAPLNLPHGVASPPNALAIV